MRTESTATEKPLKQSRATPASAAGVPHHIDLSRTPIVRVGVREDPSFQELAKQVAKDPSLFQMTEKLWQLAIHVLSSLEEAGTADNLDELFATMQELGTNPHFTEGLRDLLEKDMHLSSVVVSFKNQILRASHGHAAMMRYWNDVKLLKEWGEAMGFALVVHLIKNDQDKAAASAESYEEMEEIVYETFGTHDLKGLDETLAGKYGRESAEYRQRYEKIEAAHLRFTSCEAHPHYAVMKAVWCDDDDDVVSMAMYKEL